ncbi:cupredoxin domain-containing protein [Paenibacillus sp. GSMTC-2017]|uniref:cupredoxin domain-containing protein n=1 Tax=Paenibacillus sp. GSMTC-2017 TaxID=2794350 RepID=UPI0018D977ED|nr:cupredoxin domain-containing protein [Paenibacillus sp. GSMTC-2017]MBH5319158.1 cupredoxin domain-containing protein [Paenibacillus sp. GSMTC-2017]
MFKAFVVKKRMIQLLLVTFALVIAAGVFIKWNGARTVSSEPTETRVFELVTGEFKSKTEDGREIESYVWSPGTIVVNKGERTELRISGVNGISHPFVIKELGIEGEVIKGKTTKITFTPQEEGIFPILCLTHTDMHSGGPMVGYIVVED